MFSSNIPNFEQVKDNINKIVDLYAKDPVGFYFVDSAQHPEFAEYFGNPHAVLYRYKKKKYATYTGDDYKAFIDDVLSGNGHFKRLKEEPLFGSNSEDL